MFMAKVIYRLPRSIEDKETGRKIVLNRLEKYYVEEGKDFHFSGGFLKKTDLSKEGRVSSGKDEFALINPVFLDNYKRIKRGAQIITLKDIGPIIAYAGITKESKVIDAGSGSGGLACYLGMVAKKVDSFDVKQENLDNSRKNADALGLKNITFELKNVYDESIFDYNNYDVFTLDVPEPWRAVKTAKKVLNNGGYLVAYVPNIGQVQEFVVSLPEGMILEKTLEIIEREWSISEKVSRPVTKDFSHSAFLVFVRKIF